LAVSKRLADVPSERVLPVYSLARAAKGESSTAVVAISMRLVRATSLSLRGSTDRLACAVGDPGVS